MVDDGLAPRERAIEAFLAAHGYATAARTPLAGDASFRRYLRLAGGPRPALLMDAPPGKEDVGPYLTVARLLAGCGYSAPVVYAADPAAGLVLVEDLGDLTYTRMLGEGGDERLLYGLAVDLLADLHARPAEPFRASLPVYDGERMVEAALLLVDWYAPAVLGGPLPAVAREAFAAAWRAALGRIARVPRTLVHRDYHVDNLMWLPGREGIARCGLLDFQDAAWGPAPYDLVSLLEDARRDVPQAMAAELAESYRARLPALDEATFRAAWAVLGAQRACRILGVFTRLLVRDGKPVYLRHIPRVWRWLEGDLRHPALAEVAGWLDRHLPPHRRVVPAGGP